MFQKNSLFRKTFLLITSVVFVVVLLFSYSMVHNQKTALLDVMYSKANTIVKSIALVTSDAMVSGDDSFIVEHIQKVLQDNQEVLYIVVTSKDGISTLNESDHWEVLQTLPDSLKALNRDSAQSTLLKSSLTPQEVYHLSYPIIFTGVKWGWISIGLSLDQYNKSMQSIYQDSALLIIAMLMASILFSFILTKWLVTPILILNDAARKIAQGDFESKVDITQNGEIGELALSFNNMIEALKNSDKQLRDYNDLLEQKVAERTQDLNSLNQKLDQRVKDEVFKRAEQEQILIQQSRFAAMGEMIGNIAHQWRQPLNALGLLLQNIEYAYETDTLDATYIKKVIEKGNKLTTSMSRTIDDFRNFFKPNKAFEVFSFAKAYESTIGMIGSSLSNNMIEIEEKIDPAVCSMGFSSEFSQVILNILNNAKDVLVDKKIENKKITISIYKDDQFSYFCISDNGGGIKNDILSKIFDPYFTTKDEGKGTGIGLYMSKTIIQNNMHGSLRAENEEFGAKFSIKMPFYICEEKNNEK